MSYLFKTRLNARQCKYVMWFSVAIVSAKVSANESKLNRVFLHDVTAAILVSQNNETAAMLVSQLNQSCGS